MATKMITCPHCGTENSARKQKCFSCEQPLTARTQPGIAPGAPAVAPAAEGTVIAAPARARLRLPGDILDRSRRLVDRRPISRAPGLIGVKVRQRVQFYRQLEHLLKAGIPVGQSLYYLKDNVAGYLRPMVKDLAEDTTRGVQLWQAMERYHIMFPDWEVNLVRAAERGGNVPEAMASIAETLEMEMEMRYQVGVKLIPLQATFFMFILTILIVFLTMQAQQGNMGSVLNMVGLAFLRFFAIVIGFLLLRFAWGFYTRSRRGARVAQAIISRMPLIGHIMHLQMLYRFVQVLGALWRAGVAPMEALENAARASDSPLVMHRVADQMKRLGEGSPLSETLAATRVFPQEILYMIRSGETSGAMSESLERVGQYIRMELDAELKSLPARAQLAMYVVVGIPVAAFIIWFWVWYFGRFNAFL
ncbi:MAG: type II secretion system F family protein [Armatimonadota bacterium]